MITPVALARRAIFDVLSELGAEMEVLEMKEICNEPVVSLRVRGGLRGSEELTTTVLGGSSIAKLIDEIPILAVLGTQLKNGLEIRDAGELRVKESDRIKAIVENLKRMGAYVTEGDNGFRVERSQLRGAAIDSFGDHRIAMSFAVAGLLAEGKTEINGTECVDISFPAFFETLAGVVR